jgi:hypothetical protein
MHPRTLTLTLTHTSSQCSWIQTQNLALTSGSRDIATNQKPRAARTRESPSLHRERELNQRLLHELVRLDNDDDDDDGDGP